jgi:hypothetical protein
MSSETGKLYLAVICLILFLSRVCLQHPVVTPRSGLDSRSLARHGLADLANADLVSLWEWKLKQASCPCINLSEKSRGRWGLGLARDYETLSLGRTCTGCPGQVYGVDARWPATSAGCEPTKRQRRSFANRCAVDPIQGNAF